MGKFDIGPSIGFTALRTFAYGEKERSKMFSKIPYHGMKPKFAVSIGVKYTP
ncbi:DUF6268 family outer membrane beta-barrel protein [Sphingobacterium sp. HJSM2_6]|uniref:DUF6268 family outer membrane beta-barrel protein n=1 Tax=Sphingobacterium sp. HJSM2_6 TaxID=3366264 RepID=UPI003BE6D4AA